MGQHVGQYVMGPDGAAQAHQSHAQFLENAGEGGVVKAQPTVLLGHGDAEQPQFLHLVDQVVRHPVFAVQLGSHRLHLAAHEIAHQRDDLGTGFLVCSE